MKKIFIIILIAVLGCVSAQSQGLLKDKIKSDKNQVEKSTDSLTISLVTFYPGSLEYELYGHAGIKVGFSNGAGIFYNYGVFDFDAPNFVYRFVKGETDYMLKGYSTDYMLRGYSNRKVVEQILNLSQEQARHAYEYLVNNALPWNATYRYNYVLDNCSTRPRDIIEMATEGTLEYPAMSDTTTFREMMHRYNANYSWSQFGIDMALGSGLDRKITYREQMFVPMVLMEACAGATFVRDGERVPLVKETVVLNDGDENGDVLPPTSWYVSPMFVTILLLLIVILVSWHDIKCRSITRWFDTVLYGIMSLYGMLLFFLIFISTHEATSPNWNGVWMNPFYLFPAVLIWIKSAKKLLYCYHFANFAVLIVLMAAWCGIPQTANAAVFPLMLCPMLRSACYILIYRQKTKCEIKGEETGS
ncbi:MAG: DUF4105 domain-containing protein [Muribaculaceae bacterium]|nr:DUF4105 domain-containing protein [Muribaculaceae bacterium]